VTTPSQGPRIRPELADVPPYKPGKPAPEGAHKLSSNENPYPPLPSVVAAVHHAAGRMNRYPDAASTRLVEALAARHQVPVDTLAVGTGSVGLAQQVVQSTAGAGDEVVFAWRSFEAYPIFVRVAGATAVRVPLGPDERHDLDAMLAAVTPRTRLVLVCNPNNPTGTAVGGAAFERFLDKVPADVLVVVDEAYHEFVRDPEVPDGVELQRERPNVCVLRTFSKAYGLAGLRVGYAVAHPAVADALRRTAVPFGVSVLAEEAALASLKAEAGVELRDRVERLVAERTRVTAALRDQGWVVPPSEANFVWLRTGQRTAAVTDAMAAAGVVVRPFDGEGIRVTVADPEADDAFLAAAAAARPVMDT
jgi:histidinol-phosphate aminotransferase